MAYENVYVASFRENELFSLHDFTFHSFEHEFEPGTLLERGEPEQYAELVEMTQEEKDKFMANDELSKLMDDIIVKENTGKIVYDVCWWAGPFNNFMRGFSDFHFEV